MAKRKAAPVLDDKMPELDIPLPEDGVGSEKWWDEELTAAMKRRDKELPRWKMELDDYRDQKDKTFAINTNYTNTEQKKHQLFYKTPSIQCQPKLTAAARATPAWQQAMNVYLGPKFIDAKSLMDEVIFDMLVPCGLGVTKIGYEAVKVDATVTDQVPSPDGALDPMTGQPALVPQERVIPEAIKVWDRFYWERIEPEKFLKPTGFFSMKHDKAPWLAWQFQWSKERTAAHFGMGKDAIGDCTSEKTLAGDDDKEFRRADDASAVEVWYRASLIDPTVLNPELYRRLVLVKGREKHRAVVHENSAYQTFDANGKFISGMLGNPLHVFSLKSISETPYPPSDCASSRKLRKELSELFRIFKKQRKASIPLRGFNKLECDKNDIEAIKNGEHGSMIPFTGDPGKALVEIARANLSPETFEFVQVYQAELQKMWALGNNQQGAQQQRGGTATEADLIQQAVDTRLSAERDRVLQQFVDGAEKLSACVQMFADDEQLTEIVGQDLMQELATVDRTTLRFAFTLKPDSSIHVDASDNQAIQLRKYNLLANDPFVNREHLVEGVALAFNDDPIRLLKAPPPRQPEPPKVQLSLKGEDLINPAVLEILKAMGVPVPDMAIQAATMAAATAVGHGTPLNATEEHGGAADGIDPIDKHDADMTGMMPGPGPH